LTPVLYYAFARFTKPKADEENRLNMELQEAQKQL
jgi:cbb3-type cytochrome oxidase subunit 3